jgi:SAM-dependent methyltransferase
MPRCPVCLGSSFSVLRSDAELAREVQMRSQFVAERSPHPLSPGERKDLTDFFHNERAELLTCTQCTLLMRSGCEHPPAKNYAADPYDPSAIEQVYPQYVRAFAAKERPYRSLLPKGATVVELGSHYGAFLEVAEQWGWKAIGVDVGRASTSFARSHGRTVRFGELSDCHFETASVDGLFLWNCLDQIETPAPVLAEARRLLKPNGLLVVRTPNGLFYWLCQKMLREASLAPERAHWLWEAMAYNNLLGFPYRYGYSRATLQRLIEPFQLRVEGMLNSELLTLPLPEEPGWVVAEERQIQHGVQLLAHSVLRHEGGELIGPWIEMWFR